MRETKRERTVTQLNNGDQLLHPVATHRERQKPAATDVI
jgi:hypothetical protein